MITSKKLKFHAIEFFKTYKGSTNTPKNYRDEALNYVKNQLDFIFKDSLSGDTLVMILEEELGYLNYVENTKRLHTISSTGHQFLSNS